MNLRWYQAEAKAALYKFMNECPGENPVAVLPTGSGKTPLLSAICADVAGAWGGRVLVLAHVKELLEQAADKLARFLPAEMVGVYSAGLNSRDTSHAVICAGIQSVFKRAGELGPFSCIIIDECHLISPNDGTMYRQFLEHAKIVNPKVRIIGLTATPYRMDTGYICGPENILNEIAYEVGVKELIVQGFLCPIKTRAGKEHPDLKGIHTKGGEYVEAEMAERMDAITTAACVEIAELTKDRHHVLIFASSLEHGRHIQNAISNLTAREVGFVCGDTPAGERAELLARFKGEAGGLFGSEPLKYLVNMNVLTTGFDAPNIDAIVMMRATKSPGLWYQCVGRGLRTHTSKVDCIVLDYGENAMRHGPIDAMLIKEPGKGDGEAPVKECPGCNAVVFAGVARCPECGFEFPIPEPKYKDKAGKSGVLSGEITTTEFCVERVSYSVHHKKDDPTKPTTMRVNYLTAGLHGQVKSQWLCFNHGGYVRDLAEAWWRTRSHVPVPDTTEDAVQLAQAGALVNTVKITWREEAGKPFGEIIGYEFAGEIPQPDAVGAAIERQQAEIAAEADEWGGAPTVVTAAKATNWYEGLTDDDIPF